MFFLAMITDPSPSGVSVATRVARDLAVAGLAAFAVSMVVLWALDLTWVFGVQVLALYLAGSILILRGLPPALPGPGAGAANRVTLGRAALVLPVGALAVQPEVAGANIQAAVVLLGGVALLLDGVDGWVARRTGTGTAFGARFDMESDAFLILALSVLAWRAGPVGPWIVGIGVLRYAFVAAGKLWPALQRELPPSFRRKVVCVVQGVALLVVVAPWVPAPIATGVGAAALVSLVGSFAVDTLWAIRTPTRPAPRSYRVRRRINPSWATDATTSPSRVK